MIKVYPKGTYPPAVKKAKEARFIPCEPYKGAVSPLSNRHQKSSPSKAMGRLSLSRSSPEKSLSAPNLGLNLTPSQRKQPILPVASLQQANEERVKDDCEEKLEPIDVGGVLEMNPLLEANYRTMLDAKERELERFVSFLKFFFKIFKVNYTSTIYYLRERLMLYFLFQII